jgi:hypothetical protein
MAEASGAGHLDRTTVEVVAKLMAKAQSTGYDSEAVALVERSYSLLARVLSDYDLSTGDGSRRRERRLMRDRRKGRRDRLYGDRPAATPVVSASDGTERYRQVADAVRREGTDGPEGRGTAVSL